MTKPSVRLPLKKVLKTSSLSFAFISLLTLLGCPGNTNKPTETNTPPPAAPVAAKSDFDGDRAFNHVRKQVEFGPRPAGSAELEKTRAYIIDQLRSFGLTVTTDEFQAT